MGEITKIYAVREQPFGDEMDIYAWNVIETKKQYRSADGVHNKIDSCTHMNKTRLGNPPYPWARTPSGAIDAFVQRLDLENERSMRRVRSNEHRIDAAKMLVGAES